MDLKQLLSGLNPNSDIGPGMLDDLQSEYVKLAARSTDWNDEAQRNLELIRSLLCRNGRAVA
jgi:hypothetical protein